MRNILITFIFLTIFAGVLYGQDSYTLTTYYPAPNGKYDALETNTLLCHGDTSFEGNVGIGTTTNGTLTAQNLIVNSQSVLKGDTYIDHSTGDPFIQFQRASGAAYWFGYNTGNSKFDIRTSSAVNDQVFTVTRTGNVGIGANGNWSPTAVLDVFGDAHITQGAIVDGTTALNGATTITGATSIIDDNLTLSRSSAGSASQVIFSNAGNSSAIGNNNSNEFRISPNTNNIANANVVVTTTGMGINTTPGGNALNVSGTATISGNVTLSNALSVTNNISTTAGLVRIRNVSLSMGSVTISGTPTDTLLSANIIEAPGYLHTSDARLKENITPLTNALEKVKALQGVSFNYKNQSDRKIGLIAQNVEKIVPEVVATGSNGIKSVEYDSLVSLLIEAIKEQQIEIDQLRKIITEQGHKTEDKTTSP